MEILLITAIFVGFVFGWLSGRFRHNSVLRDMETALLQIEKENSALKDFDQFAKREIDRYGMALDFLVAEFVKLKLDGKIPEDDRSEYFYAHRHAEVKAWAFDESRSESDKRKLRIENAMREFRIRRQSELQNVGCSNIKKQLGDL